MENGLWFVIDSILEDSTPIFITASNRKIIETDLRNSGLVQVNVAFSVALEIANLLRDWFYKIRVYSGSWDHKIVALIQIEILDS